METYAVETSRLQPNAEIFSDGPSLAKPLSTEQQRAHDEIVNIFAQKMCVYYMV